MPAPLLVDGPIPMMVVAERAGPSVLRALAVEPSETVIALDGIRDDAWGRRTNGVATNAGVVFITRRSIVVRSSTLQDILNELLAVGSIVLGTEPW